MQYSELSGKYSEFCKARDIYWDRMQGEAAQLVSEYVESLSLESTVWSDHDGTSYRYVRVGVLDGGQFKETPIGAIPGNNDLSLSFVILTTLEEGHNVLPKTLITVEVDLKHDDGRLAVTVISKSPVTQFVTMASTPGKYAGTAEAIKQVILSLMDKSVFE